MTVFKHVLGGPQAAGDQWSSGFHSASATLDLAAAHGLFAAQAATAFGANGISTFWSAGTQLTDLITYQLDPATGRATNVVRGSLNVVGTAAGNNPSPRDTIVVGLRTALPGVGGRGRMNLPAPSVSNFTAAGLIAQATRQGVADRVRTMLDAMADAGCPAGLFKGTVDTVLVFTSVTVGAVAGSQRRRSNKIAQQYVSAYL